MNLKEIEYKNKNEYKNKDMGWAECVHAAASDSNCPEAI